MAELSPYLTIHERGPRRNETRMQSLDHYRLIAPSRRVEMIVAVLERQWLVEVEVEVKGAPYLLV